MGGTAGWLADKVVGTPVGLAMGATKGALGIGYAAASGLGTGVLHAAQSPVVMIFYSIFPVPVMIFYSISR